MGELLKKDRVFVEEIEKRNQKIKLYISKEALSVKQQYIYGCEVVEGNDFVKLFGERDLIEQEDTDEAEGKAVKRYISAPPPGMKIKM